MRWDESNKPVMLALAILIVIAVVSVLNLTVGRRDGVSERRMAELDRDVKVCRDRGLDPDVRFYSGGPQVFGCVQPCEDYRGRH